MHKFDDIRNDPNLKHALESQLGTLYMILPACGVPTKMIRHFDGDIPTALVKPFAELVQAVGKWIEARPELACQIKVEQLLEVGSDFVSRNYHVYYVSIGSYEDWEDQSDVPQELEHMRSTLRSALGKSADTRDMIIENVLARSLLEPSRKTYFLEDEGPFVVVEPEMTYQDVKRWADLSNKATG